MRSMSMLIGFSMVIFVALFFGSLGKKSSEEKPSSEQMEQSAKQSMGKPVNNNNKQVTAD